MVEVTPSGQVQPNWSPQGAFTPGQVDENGKITGMSITINSLSLGKVRIDYAASISGGRLAANGVNGEFASRIAVALPPAPSESLGEAGPYTVNVPKGFIPVNNVS